MSYSAIIVDDEPWSLLDIEKSFPFEELGFFVVGAFQDSRRALQAILQSPPHLVVTDIRMPNLDGLDLVSAMRQNNLETEVLILSGYSEFAYAKQAIRMGVTGYCLKPTDPAEVRDLLAEVKKKLDMAEGNGAEPAVGEALSAENEAGFEAMLAHIRAHFEDKLSLGELAPQFALNANYCCSLFAKHVGKTFSQYVTELRIQKACELLKGSEGSLETVAHQVGFTDVFYFSKVFKKQCGLSPSSYRRQEGDRP